MCIVRATCPIGLPLFFKIRTGLRCVLSQAFQHFQAAAVGDVVIEAVREVFSGVGFGVIPQPGVLRLCQIQMLMLHGEAQPPIQKVSELMERRAGIREVDGFLAVVGGSNAAHVQFLAEAPM